MWLQYRESGQFTLPWDSGAKTCLTAIISVKDSVDGDRKTPDTRFVFKQLFLFVLLGLALAGQGIASPMSCLSLAKSDAGSVEMSHCSETSMNETSTNGNESKDCCGSDCAAMLQCFQTTATFLEGAAVTETIAIKAMSHTRRLFGNPTGMHSIPEIKPPIIA